MPWRETCVVDERMRFVLAVEAGEEPVAALCRRFGISRRHGYKWLGALARRRRGRARRPVAGAAQSSAGGGGGARRGLPRRAPRASDLGAGEGAGLARAASARAARPGRRRARSARSSTARG